MRVLLSTIGTRGDVQPLVALALQLKSFGQQVRLCVPPDFQDWITSLGMPVIPIGPRLRALSSPAHRSTPSPLSLEQRRQMAEGTVAAQFETIAEAADGCGAIVAATALQIAARSIAERRGIHYVFAAYCPAILPSPHHAPPPLPPLPGQAPLPATADNRERWVQDAERFNEWFGAALNSRRESLGLPPVDDVRSHVFSSRPWLAADATLAPWPGDHQAEVLQPGAWILRDDRPLPVEVEKFLNAGEAPIYSGFGSMRVPQGVSTAIVESARALGRRAIVSRGWGEISAPEGESDTLTIDDVNQQALFKRVAAVIHHGGAGTTTTATLAGAAQVIIPQFYDQHYWAQRIQDLGIGIAHAPGSPTTESLTDALEAALQPGVAARAQSMASSISHDGALIAAHRLIHEFR
jgi:vancomycin aglycone glucosyltransferase